MIKSSRLWLLCGLLFTIVFASLTSSTNAQNSLTVYIGNVDGSPFHVPYQGTVDIPVWISGPAPYGGMIELCADTEYVSELLGGRSYISGSYTFLTPVDHGNWLSQRLMFTPNEWPQGIFHLADFTVNMDVDPSHIGDLVDAFWICGARFIDSTGYMLYGYEAHVCQLAIDDITSADDPDNMPDAFILHPAYPNPFNSSTTISFAIAVKGNARLSIFDITGRKVRTLEMGDLSIGERSVVWDGTDDNHAPVASGTYLYQIECNGHTQTARVTLLK